MSVAQEQIEGMVKDLVSRSLLVTGKALSGRVETGRSLVIQDLHGCHGDARVALLCM